MFYKNFVAIMAPIIDKDFYVDKGMSKGLGIDST
jgi:hypothetical protein